MIHCELPESLQRQLLAYRRRVWQIKMIEAVAIAIVGLGAAFLVVYAWDRLADTPRLMRWALLVTSVLLMAIVPWFVYRWVWNHRGLEPLARLLSKKLPAVGDQLLGVIELTHSDSEQARSPALCQAAMSQVAHDASGRDLNQATPPSGYRVWAATAAIVMTTILGLAAFYPAASANALARWVTPWRATPRYTFTQIEPLADEIVIAHGEPVSLVIQLSDASRWQPAQAELSIGGQPPVSSQLEDGHYTFQIPPQISKQGMTLSVGDVRKTVNLNPMLRPELSSMVADVRLPAYLQQPETQVSDSRGGNVTAVRGSTATFTATINRALASGQINDQACAPIDATLTSRRVQMNDLPTIKFQWKDHWGLSGREPFELSLHAIDDEAPTLICDGLARQSVILDTETLTFRVRASDDFGVRQIGMMWRGLDDRVVQNIAQGERPLAAGTPEADDLDVLGTFSAKSLGIEPQPIELFVWAEDYLPNRKRVLSPPHILYILTPDQHAIWMTEQLSKWHRQAMDVRDRERQLYEKNKELRSLSPSDLDSAESRREVKRQASAERANGRRLDRLGELGDQLVQTASRNPEIGVGHLERWAEMLQVLRDLSENRMPSVADLLTDASGSTDQIGGDQANSRRSSSRDHSFGEIRRSRSAPPRENASAACGTATGRHGIVREFA